MPPHSLTYDPLIAQYDSLSNVVNEALKANTTPYFLAYFQRSFDLNKEYLGFFHREGNVEKRTRDKFPYNPKDSVKYREKFALLEPDVVKK